jgi:Nif-specific regulatory protein
VIVLEVVNGDAQGRIFKTEDSVVTLGRAEVNSFVLGDYHLSSQHGRIFVDGDQFIYRDLRSTNGSTIRRGEDEFVVDAGVDWEITLHSGDELLLGDPSDPVVLKVDLADVDLDEAADLGDKLIASRSIIDLPKVADQIEGDPASALRIYKSLAPLSRCVDMSETLNTIVDATYQLLARATHCAILVRSEADKDRFTVALARARESTTNGESDAVVPASRAVLRKVLEDGAAVLTADAAEDLGSSESIMGGRIRAMIAIPLWREDKITGLIQVDNRSSAGIFSETDLEVALLLGAQAALALDNASLVSRLKIAEERLTGENVYLKRKEGTLNFDSIIHDSQVMDDVISQLEKVLDTRATVCVEGETGTGKELIASAIHYQSRRADKMFVAQNCAALPETLLESELFGHRKGSFTGADNDKKGLFEIADGGTLFLDEVGEMPLALQAKLLRALQEGTIRPVGSTVERQVDVRIICATNRDLAAEVEKGNFRQDLFYRLMVFPIRLPPLRERREDIPLLAEYFLKRYSSEYRRNIEGINQEALDALSNYSWPGNIRELENEIQRLVIQAEENGWIETTHLSPQLRKVEGTLARIAPKKGTLKEMMEQVERWLLAEALRDHDGNKTRTAVTLGITREGLHKKLSKFGM